MLNHLIGRSKNANFMCRVDGNFGDQQNKFLEQCQKIKIGLVSLLSWPHYIPVLKMMYPKRKRGKL